MDGRARSVCTEQMLMILPEPRASWCRATSRPTRNALVRSVVRTRFQSSRLTSSNGRGAADRRCSPGSRSARRRPSMASTTVVHLVGVGDVESARRTPCLAEPLAQLCRGCARVASWLTPLSTTRGAGPGQPGGDGQADAPARPGDECRSGRSGRTACRRLRASSGASSAAHRVGQGADSAERDLAVVAGFDRGEGAGRAGEHDVAGAEA